LKSAKHRTVFRHVVQAIGDRDVITPQFITAIIEKSGDDFKLSRLETERMTEVINFYILERNMDPEAIAISEAALDKLSLFTKEGETALQPLTGVVDWSRNHSDEEILREAKRLSNPSYREKKRVMAYLKSKLEIDFDIPVGGKKRPVTFWFDDADFADVFTFINNNRPKVNLGKGNWRSQEMRDSRALAQIIRLKSPEDCPSLKKRVAT
jgi:hypothetical protein